MPGLSHFGRKLGVISLELGWGLGKANDCRVDGTTDYSH
jgi:hypothetical protein